VWFCVYAAHYSPFAAQRSEPAIIPEHPLSRSNFCLFRNPEASRLLQVESAVSGLSLNADAIADKRNQQEVQRLPNGETT